MITSWSLSGTSINKISAISLIQFLDFSSNRLSSLPANLSDLKHLREIILSMNRFSAIPECLYSCAKLETILIRDNQVSVQCTWELLLCLWCFMLVYLKIINLSTFQVASLEVSKLSQLSMLAVLDVQNDAIAYVPPELGKFIAGES